MLLLPNQWDPSTRLLCAIVCLRVAMGSVFMWIGYNHWQDTALVQGLTSQWVDWTVRNPLFWIQDLYHWLIIPNASIFARIQMMAECLAGFSVFFGLFHQWGIQVVLAWVTVHLLLVSHLQQPYLTSALMGIMLVAGILWLADAGRWLGLDKAIYDRQRLTPPKPSPEAI